jgi:PAS domain S-box-containing protein
LPPQTVFNDYEVRHDFARIGPRTILLNARRLDHVKGILLAMEDITPRKDAETQAQEALRAANARVKLILDSITDQFFAVDHAWRFTYFNVHAAAQLKALGKDPAGLLGTVLWEAFPHPASEAALRRAMSERVMTTDEQYYAPLGEWYENRIYPSPDGGLAVFQRYVTERKRIEEALRRSEAYLAEAQRLSHTASWAWHVATGELFWSPEHFRICGLDPDRVQPSSDLFFQLVHPEDRPVTQQTFDQAVRDRHDVALDYRIVRPDGMIRHIRSIAHPVFNASSDLTEYVGTSIDTTERTRAEAQLRASEQRFRQVADAIPHLVWSCLPDGTMDYCNRRWVEYTGLTVADTQDYGWTNRLHPDDVEPAVTAWREAKTHGTPYEVEQRVRGVDGRYRRFLSRAVPLYDEQGQLIQWFGTYTDIEALKQAEEALRTSEARFRDLVEGSIQGVLVHRHFRPLFVNPAYAALFGYTPAEILAMDSILELLAPHERAQLQMYHEAHLRGAAAPAYYECQGIRKDGRRIWLETRAGG